MTADTLRELRQKAAAGGEQGLSLLIKTEN